MLGYVMGIYSAKRLRLLAERSAYVIAGADRGQLCFVVVRDYTGEVSKKHYSGESTNVSVANLICSQPKCMKFMIGEKMN